MIAQFGLYLETALFTSLYYYGVISFLQKRSLLLYERMTPSHCELAGDYDEVGQNKFLDTIPSLLLEL